MRGTTGRRRRGFTMVEMTIVIGIVILLAALTLSVSVVVVQGAEVRQTETTLRLLDLALQEWESLADRKLTWGRTSDNPLVPYDLEDGTPHVFVISELLDVIGRPQPVKQVIARIDPELVHRYDSADPAPPWLNALGPDDPDPNAGQALSEYNSGDWDGSIAVLDAWGRPIRVVHPGRPWDPLHFPEDDGQVPDEDGTIPLTLTYAGIGTYGVEQCYGTAVNRRVCFVSAGPDGKFGDASAAVNSAEFEPTKDNVYSYAPAKPRGAGP